MYTENYISSLQADLLELVESHLTPAADHYGYSDTPLETHIKWRPLVLIIGNYSSGKSTLINDFLGAEIQATGQAPTDDSFTVLTFDDSEPAEGGIRVTEQRDGNYLLSNQEYPFEGLKKYGQQFAAHFCLKKVNSPFLKNFAIIDTPGMLDSLTERDRGYDYLRVIGDLAHTADLVLMLFDPHKAGTIREAHVSLRETLPSRTFENRILFVLNRIDECASLIDLIRVYGTLCWNLSQITGRKDIPPIRLTYSLGAAEQARNLDKGETSYLHHLDNQREELKEALMQAPHYHLDHLATFLEIHSSRLAHLLEALLAYRQRRRTRLLKFSLTGLIVSLLAGAGLGGLMAQGGLTGSLELTLTAGGIFAASVMILWITLGKSYYLRLFHNRQMKTADDLTPLDNQRRQEVWQAIKPVVLDYLKKTGGIFPLWRVKQDFAVIDDIATRETKEIREALNEMTAASSKNNFDPSSAYQAFLKEKQNDRSTL